MTSLLSRLGNIPPLLSSTSVTWAKPTLPRCWVPPKMTSSIRLPRRLRTDCSPMTQQMASEILLFPEPLGPTMAVMSSPKRSMVLSGKDLKPWISNALRYILSPASLHKPLNPYGPRGFEICCDTNLYENFYKSTVKWYKFWYKISVVSFYTTKSRNPLRRKGYEILNFPFNSLMASCFFSRVAFA